MIDRTYGHLAPDAEDYERGVLDAFDNNNNNNNNNNTAEAARCRRL